MRQPEVIPTSSFKTFYIASHCRMSSVSFLFFLMLKDSSYYAGKASAIVKAVRPHWGLITFTPIFLGGLYQLFNLLFIGISYVRFFSTTQLIQDGLAFLILFLLMYALAILTKVRSEKRAKDKIEEKGDSETFYWKLMLTYVTVGIISTTYHRFPFKDWITGIFYFSGSAALLGTWSGLLLKDFGIFKEKFFLKWMRIFYRTFLITFILSFVFIFRLLNNLGESSSLSNIQNVYCYLESHAFSADSYEILYFNDKYIFVEETIGEKNKIRILPFSTFFESTKCVS